MTHAFRKALTRGVQDKAAVERICLWQVQKEFITKAVDAIAYNASQTLDGKHGDDHPTQDLLGKVFYSANKIKAMVTGLKDKSGSIAED